MNRSHAIASGLTAVLTFSICLLASPPAQAQDTGQWQFTGSMASGHGQADLGQLADGRVLAIGGDVGGHLANSVEIYSPANGQWTPAGSLNVGRGGFGQPSLLPDGRLLVATGDVANSVETNTAEIYDPNTGTWSMTGSVNQGRRADVQVGLANGEVLIATGAYGGPTCGRFLSSAELYDPATGQWTYTGSTLVPREGAYAIRLADGRVLLAGGDNGGTTCTNTAPADTEIYDPATGQWSFAGNLPHGWLNGAMVLLPDHRVLLVDGWQFGSGNFAEAAIFNPATNQWSEAASPILPRSSGDATLLPDGDVLVSQGGQLQSEIYDPAANTWSLDATTLDENNSGQTFLLPNGKVLLAGGYNNAGPTVTTELYAPPQTGSTTVSLTDSTGNPISGATVAFRSASGSATNATTGPDGTASVTLTPGSYSVTMYYANGYQTKTLSVTAAGPNTVAFATIAVTAQINDPDSADLAAASVAQAGNTGTYGPKTPVDSNGQVTFQVLPGTNTFAAYDANGYQTKIISVTGASTVTFATVTVTAQINDPHSADLATASVAHAGNTGTYGPKTPVDGNGQVTFQALPGTSTFTAYDANGYQTQTITITGPTTVTFATVAVTVTVLKNGAPLTTASVAHAGNTGTFSPKTPVDSNGQVTFQVLPGTNTFTAWDGNAYTKETLTVTAPATTTISVN